MHSEKPASTGNDLRDSPLAFRGPCLESPLSTLLLSSICSVSIEVSIPVSVFVCVCMYLWKIENCLLKTSCNWRREGYSQGYWILSTSAFPSPCSWRQSKAKLPNRNTWHCIGQDRICPVLLKWIVMGICYHTCLESSYFLLEALWCSASGTIIPYHLDTADEPSRLDTWLGSRDLVWTSLGLDEHIQGGGIELAQRLYRCRLWHTNWKRDTGSTLYCQWWLHRDDPSAERGEESRQQIKAFLELQSPGIWEVTFIIYIG